MTASHYLERLPASLAALGDSARGEIEIVTDPALVAQVRAARQRNSAAPESSAPHARDDLGFVFEDEYLCVVRDPVRFPGGEMGTYIRVIERAGLTGTLGIVALPVRDGRILLRENFRHANRRWELEAPRGMRESGDNIEQTLRQEVAQELGLPIIAVHPLGSIVANSGLLSGDTDLFLVHVGEGDENSQGEPKEALGRIVELEISELMDRIASGEITDAHTLSVVLRAIALGHLTLDESR